jgi:hypothetical protein
MKKLEALEQEFQHSLIACLQQCALGRWGLFGTYDHLGEDRRYWEWPEADRLRELANSICETRKEFGEENQLCTEFLRLCTLHRANDPGEPTLATTFLQSLRSRFQDVEVQER